MSSWNCNIGKFLTFLELPIISICQLSNLMTAVLLILVGIPFIINFITSREKRYMAHQFYNQLHKILVEAQAHRAERTDFHDGRFGWEVYEEQTLLDSVNELRRQLGKSPVTADDIERAGIRAGGHVDYTQKFALYCSELVEVE
jgi:hypothetical protein